MGKRGGHIKLPLIPPDSPLGLMIKYWNDFPSRRGKDRAKMVHYCMEVWGGQKIRADNIYWPVFGSSEDRICQALNLYVNSKEPFSWEEREMWGRLSVNNRSKRKILANG